MKTGFTLAVALAAAASCPRPAFAAISPDQLQAYLGDYQLVLTARGACAGELTVTVQSGSDKGDSVGVLMIGDTAFPALDQGWQESGDRDLSFTRSKSTSGLEFLTGRPVLRNHTEHYVRNDLRERKETEVRVMADGRVEVETERHGRGWGDRSAKCFYVRAEPGQEQGQGQDQGPYQK